MIDACKIFVLLENLFHLNPSTDMLRQLFHNIQHGVYADRELRTEMLDRIADKIIAASQPTHEDLRYILEQWPPRAEQAAEKLLMTNPGLEDLIKIIDRLPKQSVAEKALDMALEKNPGDITLTLIQHRAPQEGPFGLNVKNKIMCARQRRKSIDDAIDQIEHALTHIYA